MMGSCRAAKTMATAGEATRTRLAGDTVQAPVRARTDTGAQLANSDLIGLASSRRSRDKSTDVLVGLCGKVMPPRPPRANELTAICQNFFAGIFSCPLETGFDRIPADQTQHRLAVKLQLARPYPGDRRQARHILGLALGYRGQGRVGEDHIGRHRRRGGDLQPPLAQPLEQLLIQCGRTVGATAQLAVGTGEQGRAADPAADHDNLPRLALLLLGPHRTLALLARELWQEPARPSRPPTG